MDFCTSLSLFDIYKRRELGRVQVCVYCVRLGLGLGWSIRRFVGEEKRWNDVEGVSWGFEEPVLYGRVWGWGFETRVHVWSEMRGEEGGGRF